MLRHSVEQGGQEGIGLVAEVDPKKIDGAPEEILRQIRMAVAETFDVVLDDVGLIPPRAIYKTTSGKIQRRRTRQALLAGEFSTLARWTAPTVLEGEAPIAIENPEEATAHVLAKLVWALVAKKLFLDSDAEPQHDATFRELGVSSVTAVEISGELADILKRKLSPTLLFEFSSTNVLAAYLAGETTGDATELDSGIRARLLRDAMRVALENSGLPLDELPSEESFAAFLGGRDNSSLAQLSTRGAHEDFSKLVPRWLNFLQESYRGSRILLYLWSFSEEAYSVYYREADKTIREQFDGRFGPLEDGLNTPDVSPVVDIADIPNLRGDWENQSGLAFGFRIDGKLQAAVQVLHASPEAYTESDRDLLERVCEYVGPALLAGQSMSYSDSEFRAENDLADLAEGILQDFSFEHFVEDVLSTGSKLFDAESAALFLYDDDAKELYLMAGSSGANSSKTTSVQFSADTGLCGHVFQTEQRIWVEDVQGHPNFNPAVDSKGDFVVRNMLCAPVMGAEGPLGVVELLNCSLTGIGAREHSLLDRYVRQIAVAIHSLPLIADMHVPFLRSLNELQAVEEPTESQESPFAEPVAVVGMGCRFPGGVHSRGLLEPSESWRRCHDGNSKRADSTSTSITIQIPMRRKNGYPKRGFLEDIDLFDAEFFGISPREAEQIDPQQRLLLECSWEALEHAGILPSSLMGSDTGVFVGQIYQDYAHAVGDAERVDGYTLTGNTASVASGRISYYLGSEGPSMTIDTACSSSLVGVHLACQALANGESIAGLGGWRHVDAQAHAVYWLQPVEGLGSRWALQKTFRLKRTVRHGPRDAVSSFLSA